MMEAWGKQPTEKLQTCFDKLSMSDARPLPANNALPIPDGVVFTCRFDIPAAANVGDTFAIRVAFASAVFPDGHEVDVTAASQGSTIRVVETAACPQDLDGDGEVSLGEVQKAFNAYLHGCPQ
jgi:hypothetical protein